MKLWPNAGLTTLIVFAGIVAGCSDNPGASPSGEKTMLESADAASLDGSASSASLEVEIARVERESLERDNFLQGQINSNTAAIAAEALARANADMALEEKVNNLETKVDGIRTELKADVARLEAEDVRILGVLTDKEKALQDAINTNASAISTNAGAIAANSATITAIIAQADRDRADNLAARQAIVTQLQETAARLSADLEAAKVALRAEFAAAIAAEAAARAAGDTALAGQLAAKAAELNTKIEDTEAALETAIAAAEGRVNVRIDGLSDELKAEIADLEKETGDALAAINMKISQLNGQLLELRQALEASEEKLIAMINKNKADGEAALAALATRLGTEVARLDAAITGNSNAIATLRTDFEAHKIKTQGDVDALNGRVDEANAAIVALTNEMNRRFNEMSANLAEVEAALKAKDDELLKLINDNKAAGDAALADLANRLGTSITTLKATVDANAAAAAAAIASVRSDLSAHKAKVEQDLANVRNEFKAADEAQLKELTQKILDLDLRLQEEHEQFEAQIEANRVALMKEVEALRDYSNATFATKEQLAELDATLVAMIDNLANTLNKKIDANDAALRAEIKSQTAALAARIDAVEASVASLRTDFTKHVAEYKQTIADMKAEAKADLAKVNEELARLANADEAFVAKLNGAIERITNLEFYAQETRQSLEDKVTELEAKVIEQGQDYADALNAAKAELLAAIAAEQAAREELASEVDRLTAEVKKIKAIAQQALDMANANKTAIAGVAADLEAAKKTFAKEIDDLRAEMKAGLEEVETYAEEIVKDLDESVQKQFVEISTELAELQSRDDATRADILRVLVKMAMLVGKLDPKVLDQNTSKDMNLLVSQANAYSTTLLRIENSFLETIYPVHFTRESALGIIGERFADVAASPFCGGHTGREDQLYSTMQAASVAYKPWYMHLARGYVRLLVSGIRSRNATIDSIFFGVAPAANGSDFASAIALHFSKSFASSITPECDQLIDSWAKQVLMGTDTVSAWVRAQVVNSNAIKGDVVSSKPDFDNVGRAANAYENLLRAELKKFIPDAAKIDAIFTKGTAELPPFRTIAAQAVVTRSDLNEQLAINGVTQGKFIELARSIAKMQDQVNKNTARITKLEADVAALRAKIDQVSARVDNVTAALGDAFAIVAEMARRLGYTDLITAIKEASKKYNIPVDTTKYNLPISITGVQHRFLDLDPRKRITACWSSIWDLKTTITSRACRGYQEINVKTRTVTNTYVFKAVVVFQHDVQRVHRGWYNLYVRGLVGAPPAKHYLYGNPVTVIDEIRNIHVQIEKKEKQVFVNKTVVEVAGKNLKAYKEIYPDHVVAPKLIALQAGDLPVEYNGVLQGAIILRLYGQFIGEPNDEVAVCTPTRSYCKTVSLSSLRVTPNTLDVVINTFVDTIYHDSRVLVDIKRAGKILASVVAQLGAGTKATFTQLPDVNNPPVVTNAGTFYVNGPTQYKPSPIVLDLSAMDNIRVIPTTESKVNFDVNNDGFPENVSWIAPEGAGFLALDRNGDGIINHGGELFGDSTFLSTGRKATNGYEALAEFALPGSDVIDSSNPVFKDLLVWVDLNSDGISQKEELKPLSAYGVTKLSVVPQAVPAEMVNRGHPDTGAHFIYQSRFWGPEKCGTEGCKTYDVYFNEAGKRIASGSFLH